VTLPGHREPSLEYAMRHWKCMVLFAIAIGIAACDGLPTEIDKPQETENPLLKKGGGGKPGGGGGAATLPDPSIAFQVAKKGNVLLYVMNVDGSHRTMVFDDWTSAPSWAPFGEGTMAQPFRIVFYGTRDKTSFTADIDTVGGTVNVRNVDPFPFNPGAGLVWGPGAGTEMAYVGVDNVLYIASDVTLPNPKPVPVYTPPAGHTLAYPTWSPAGDAIAFREESDSGNAIKVLNRSTGVVTTIWDFGEFAGERQIDWSRTLSNPKLAVPVTVSLKRGSTT